MAEIPSQNEESVNKTPTTEDDVKYALRRAGEFAFTEAKIDSLVLALFEENITADEIEKQKRLLGRWSYKSFNQQTGQYERKGLEHISDETAITAITMNRARNFWRYGVMFSDSKQDIDRWLAVVSRQIFATIADRTMVYPEEAVSSKVSHSDRIGGNVTGIDLYEAVARIGDKDTAYLATMARKINDIALLDEEANINLGLREIARGFMRHASNVFVNKGGHVQIEHNPQKLVDATEIDPNTFLALASVNLQEIAKKANTPSAILAKFEFLKVGHQSKRVFQTFRSVLHDSLSQTEPENRKRESLDFVRGASRLLFSSLEFAASSAGLGSANAVKMHEYLYNTNNQPGRQAAPTRRSLIALANQITPSLQAVLNDDDLHQLKTDIPFDTYFAIDRLFAFIEYEAVIAEKPEVSEILETAADCALQLADHGLTQIDNKTSDPINPQTPPLTNEPGPKGRRKALHRVGKPGYGKLS